MRWRYVLGSPAAYARLLAKVNVPLKFWCSRLETQNDSSWRPARMLCFFAGENSMLSSTSSSLSFWSPLCPAPPVENASMTMTAGSSFFDTVCVRVSRYCTLSSCATFGAISPVSDVRSCASLTSRS